MNDCQQVFLAARPEGFPKLKDFGLRKASLREPDADEILVEIEFLSVDPYMRGHMQGGIYRTMKPLEIGDTLYGGAVGRVLRSRSPLVAEGEVVEGYLGWQSHATVRADSVRKIDATLAPISTALGILGMPGMTAYFGMTEVAKPRAGETVVVSAAAGAVGSTAAQIARILGCRVVGIAGGTTKTRHLTEDLRLHAGIDYKAAPDLHEALVAACPDKIDVYFDNVGGDTYDATTRWMNYGFRYIICGSIAEYSSEEAGIGPRHLKRFEVNRARMQGFGVAEYRPRYNEGIAQMAKWLNSGELHYRESISDGLETAPNAFIEMLQGKNTGKQLVRVKTS